MRKVELSLKEKEKYEMYSQVKPKKENFAEEFGQRKERMQSKQNLSDTDTLAPPKNARVNANYSMINPVASYLPIKKIENGIIYTKDHWYVKLVEIIPINFLLRSAREQRNIIYSFISYFKRV